MSAAKSLAPLSPEQKSFRWKILIATYMGYMGYYLTRKVFTICKKPIADQFGWELGEVAHIWTAFLVAYMLGQFISSFVGRKYGPRILLLGGLGFSILCNIFLGFANSYGTFMVFMFFNGLVQASGWPGAVGGISRWVREAERGTLMGIWTTSYVVGNIVVKSLGGLLLGMMGWRWSFFGCTLLTVSIWLIIYAWQKDKPEDAGLAPIVPDDPEAYQAVEAAQQEQISFKDYVQLAFSPVILIMGASYFCVKFMRYALDSWLPAFLSLQGLNAAQASYYSQLFDITGLVGAILAGWALDRVFRGNWALLSFLMAVGAIGGYLAVIYLGTSPLALALCFSIVGFMLYGPDTLLSGAAAVEVAGARNGVAVAGLVNGVGSIGPVVQEEVIGWIVSGDQQAALRNTNLLTLGMSVLFALLMAGMVWRLHQVRQAHLQEDSQKV